MLGIAVEKVCDLITHIRAFDIKIPADYSRQSDTTTEVTALEAVEDGGEEPVYDELAFFIVSLNEEEANQSRRPDVARARRFQRRRLGARA